MSAGDMTERGQFTVRWLAGADKQSFLLELAKQLDCLPKSDTFVWGDVQPDKRGDSPSYWVNNTDWKVSRRAKGPTLATAMERLLSGSKPEVLPEVDSLKQPDFETFYFASHDPAIYDGFYCQPKAGFGTWETSGHGLTLSNALQDYLNHAAKWESKWLSDDFYRTKESGRPIRGEWTFDIGPHRDDYDGFWCRPHGGQATWRTSGHGLTKVSALEDYLDNVFGGGESRWESKVFLKAKPKAERPSILDTKLDNEVGQRTTAQSTGRLLDIIDSSARMVGTVPVAYTPQEPSVCSRTIVSDIGTISESFETVEELAHKILAGYLMPLRKQQTAKAAQTDYQFKMRCLADADVALSMSRRIMEDNSQFAEVKHD